jgi:hypothetical protein
MLLTSPKNDMWAAVTALTAGAMTWQSTALMAGLLMAWSAMGLFTEWQSRRTLVALVHAAPAGLITIQRDRPDGQVLWLAWGAYPDLERQSRS